MSQTDKEPIGAGEAGEAELRAELDECRRELAALRERATELEADRARLETVLAALPVGVVVAGPQGEILAANEAAKALFGGEVTGTARGPVEGYALCHPDGGPFPPDQLPLPRALERGETSRDVEILVRGARERTVLASGAPVYGPEGEIRGAVVVMQDITDRKRAEEGLVQAASEMGRQRRLLLTVFEHAPVGIAIVDGAELRGKSANPAYLEFLEKPYRTRGIAGVALTEFVPGAEESGLPALFRKVARTGVAYYDPEYKHVGFPRGVTYWRYSLIPLPAGAGEPADVMIVAIEVTEQVRARREAEALADGLHGAYEQLARQNELLQRLFDHIPVLLVMWDPRLQRFTLNPCAEEVLGWTTGDANEGDFMSKVYPDPSYRAEVAAYMQSLQPGWREWIGTTKSGERVPIDWANIRLSDDTSIGIGVDLRERKKAEDALREAHAQLQIQAEELQVANEELQAQREELGVANEELRIQTDELQVANRHLQESRERLARAQEIAHLGSWELDLVHNHLTWSDEVYRIFGLQPREFAATYEAFLDYVHPDDRAAVDEAYTGSIREDRDSYEIEHRVVRPTGEVRIVHEKCQHFRDPSGRIVRSVGMVHDTTERKEAEETLAAVLRAERDAREEAQEANQAKDQFVALVSHELRNPLNAITAGLHLLRATCPTEGRAGRALEIVVRNANLQARLVNDLLDLSRLQRGKLQLQRAPVELAKVVAAACQAYDAEATEAGLTLTCDAETGLWVHGDFDRLQQVMMNLLSNAVKFTPAGGKIRVGVWEYGGMGVAGSGTNEHAPARDESGTPTPPHPHTPIHPHPHTPTRVARVVVEDTGIGIDRELLSHLFTMFRQGEVAGKQKPGLGLGLALVKGIVERHGGRVWAESEGVGKGSRFLVELPLVEAPGLRARRPGGAGRVPEPRASRRARVLVIEDNPDTRTMLADALTLSDYEVQTAGSGEEALEVLAEARPDIMVVDIGLPGISGFEFLQQARELPGMADVPAFAVTGFGAEEDVLRGREAGFAGHFVKPVNVATLLERIREWTGTSEDERVNG